MNKYNIIIKTGEAEIKALENIPKDKISSLFPIIELTRGRKITKNNQISHPFNKRLDKLKKIFEGQEICIDVTSDPTLSSEETQSFYNPHNGYEKWINFLHGLEKEKVFKNITPTILWNFNDPNFQENITLQIRSLTDLFGKVAYRNAIEDDGFYDDISIYLSTIPFYFILDCGYVPQASYNNVAEKVISRLSNIKTLIKDNNSQFCLVSTSYPNNVNMFGDSPASTLRLTEIDLYNHVKEIHKDIIYGDYGLINPIRNDTIVMSRGWIPKIDVPLENSVYYYRQRRPSGITSYSGTYIQVANACVNDGLFPHSLEELWGVKQIISCSNGSVPSSSPSFWISVRMNIHIQQQIRNRFS